MAGVDAGAKVVVYAAFELRQKRFKLLAIFVAAHLDVIHAREHADLVTEGAEIFERCADFLERRSGLRERAPD